MNDLPKVITDLTEAQNNADSSAYANCFSETAVVFDEGKKYNGRAEIEHWIAESNRKYKTAMEPIGFEEKGTGMVLTAEISGTFPGSPITLQYHLEIVDGLIQSLKISG